MEYTGEIITVGSTQNREGRIGVKETSSTLIMTPPISSDMARPKNQANGNMCGGAGCTRRRAGVVAVLLVLHEKKQGGTRRRTVLRHHWDALCFQEKKLAAVATYAEKKRADGTTLVEAISEIVWLWLRDRPRSL